MQIPSSASSGYTGDLAPKFSVRVSGRQLGIWQEIVLGLARGGGLTLYSVGHSIAASIWSHCGQCGTFINDPSGSEHQAVEFIPLSIGRGSQ
jgi:hypothetical protein